jgi:hypothetical protein
MTESTVPDLPAVSNVAFLQAIFGEDWTRAHVCSFAEDPGTLEANALGHLWAGGHADASLAWMNAGENQFFCISLFDGLVRRKALFERCHCIVVDDVGEGGSAKIDPLDVEGLLGTPSWKLETSPHNEQWGYLLDEPITSRLLVEALLTGIIDQFGGEDPGMSGVTRYVRLPEGSNTKAKYVGPEGRTFSCHLTDWSPDITINPELLYCHFGIDPETLADDTAYAAPLDAHADPILQALATLGLVTGEKPNGAYDITCPWIDEHTDRVDSGSLYFSPQGFKCHHGHCQDRTFRDLRLWLEDQTGADMQAAREQSAVASMADLVPATITLPTPAVAPPVIWHPIHDITPATSTAGLIKGLLQENALAVLYGEPGAGKSFLTMELATAVATGEPFFDRPTIRGPVAYVAAEGGSGVRNRFAAIRHHRSATKPISAADELRVALEPFLLDSLPELTKICQSLDTWPTAPVLIVIDTLARSIYGDENTATDMGAFVQACDALRTRYGAAVLIVHHTGKDAAKGARGSSALKAAVDTEISVTSTTAGRFWEATKQRDFEEGDPQAFALRPVVVGATEDGDTITSCVVEAVAAPEAEAKRRVVLRGVHEKDCWQEIAGGCVRPEDWATHEGETVVAEDTLIQRIIACSTSYSIDMDLAEELEDGVKRRSGRSGVRKKVGRGLAGLARAGLLMGRETAEGKAYVFRDFDRFCVEY